MTPRDDRRDSFALRAPAVPTDWRPVTLPLPRPADADLDAVCAHRTLGLSEKAVVRAKLADRAASFEELCKTVGLEATRDLAVELGAALDEVLWRARMRHKEEAAEAQVRREAAWRWYWADTMLQAGAS